MRMSTCAFNGVTCLKLYDPISESVRVDPNTLRASASAIMEAGKSDAQEASRRPLGWLS